MVHKAAEQGDADAQSQPWSDALQRPRSTYRITMKRSSGTLKSAEQGDAVAQYNLWGDVRHRKRSPEDDKEAVTWSPRRPSRGMS